MDKIVKALKKLFPKERTKLKEILDKINRGDFSNLDLVKLKGKREIYRVRKGNLRVIFIKNEEEINILTVERRSDTTYNL
jgi:mRNA-degrading endonuclease RelE of RelBE toxin-antitoxin system